MFTCPPLCVVRFRTVYFHRCADKLCVFSCETFAFICCRSRLFDKRERFANSEHSVSFHSMYRYIMVQSFTIDYAPPSGQSILHCCSFAQLMHDVVCSCVRICNKLHPHILPSILHNVSHSFVRSLLLLLLLRLMTLLMTTHHDNEKRIKHKIVCCKYTAY